ncbi:MAG: hypothetical protein PF495_08515 [Spirochaetales bacterium]|jgi:hypothetical protein|nr:hypothetical protein [Spirochaetales bacterium]
MGILMHMLSKGQMNTAWYTRLHAKMSGLSESFWFVSALLLFILLGPFSAVVAVVALFHLSGSKAISKMKTPVKS